ncbi:MAG TPA: hypothetical protein VF407_21165 [Polyangiaceae bacterium]
MRVKRSPAFGVALVCALAVLAPAGAHADDASDDELARAAYDRGLIAHEKGDELEAEHAFAEADRLRPSNAALEAAVASALRADDPAGGMDLVDLASHRRLDEQAAATVLRAKNAFASRVMTVEIQCRAQGACEAQVDRKGPWIPLLRAGAPRVLHLLPAAHHLSIHREDTNDEIDIEGREGGDRTFIPTNEPQPKLPPPATTSEGKGWKMPVAIAGIGVSAALVAFTIASAVDLSVKRIDFSSGECGYDAPASTVPSSNCNALSDSGHAAQIRTNVLLAGSIVATGLTALFIFEAKPFGAKSDVKMSAAIGPTGAGVRFVVP